MSTAENGFQPDFIIIPGNVLRDPELTPSAKLVYGRLKLYAGKDGRCFMKHQTLAPEVCLSVRQVRYTLEELRAAGWIEWRRGQTTCTYTVHSDRQCIANQDRQCTAALSGNTLPHRSAIDCQQKRRVKNHHQKRSREKMFSAPSTLEVAATPEEKTENTKSISKNGADDEKPKPQNAAERLKAWAAERGDPLSLGDFWAIKDSAESRGLDLAGVADLAEKNAGNWKSSAAGLRWLIKQYGRKTTDAPEERAKPAGPCSKCRGLGVVAWEPERIYCDCSMAVEVQRADVRTAALRAKAEEAERATA